jgi:3-hydroxy-9,10-secoandrosta-1,3,5(10)-triene-9,17-dione monooxygenase
VNQGLRSPETNLTVQELLARAEAMRPQLLAQQAETEERTYYSKEMHAAFRDAGFYRTLQPRRFGGYEFDGLPMWE